MLSSFRPFLALTLVLPWFTAAQETSIAKIPQEVKDHIKKISDTEYELGEIRIDSKKREIRFPAVINLRQGEILEYALVHENGKTHESLLRTTVKPLDINVAMLLLHHHASAEHLFDSVEEDEKKPSADAKVEKDDGPVADNRVEIRVLVKEKDETKEVRLEDWILDRAAEKPMSHRFWVFTGSEMLPTGFRADLEGDIVAIYLAAGSIFNNPGEGNNNDERWTTLPEGELPAKDTEVTVVISPFKAEAK